MIEWLGVGTLNDRMVRGANIDRMVRGGNIE